MCKAIGIRWVMLAGVGALLCGCGETPMPAKTVDFYKTHKVERSEMLGRCAATPKLRLSDEDCINASAADTAVNNAKRGGLQLDVPDASGPKTKPPNS